MREVNGDSPKNARIKIDYSKNKPKVTFSYPSKEHQSGGSMFYYIAFVVWIFSMLIFFSYTVSISPNKLEKLNQIEEYNISNYSEFLIYLVESDKLHELYEKYNDKFLFRKIMRDGDGELTSLLFMLSSLVLSFIIYFPFKKKWVKFYPKFQGWISKKKIKTFNNKDIRFNEKESNYFCELPVFNNIVLDYKATQDFSKYLELFEIREHDFKYYLYPRFRKHLLRKRKGKDEVKRKELNEGIWYARFYFNKKPIKGKIEVIFK